MDTDDQNALLLFRVGPVCCCAPSGPVAGVVPPPALHRPPGSDALHPGVFRHGGHLVKVIDLGHGFGVPIPEGEGRIIVTELPAGCFGFRVDDIIDVLEWPASGWGNLPPPIPRTRFRRTLQHDGQLCLYTEFERLAGIEGGGILRDYLQAIEPTAREPTILEPPIDAGATTGAPTPADPDHAPVQTVIEPRKPPRPSAPGSRKGADPVPPSRDSTAAAPNSAPNTPAGRRDPAPRPKPVRSGPPVSTPTTESLRHPGPSGRTAPAKPAPPEPTRPATSTPPPAHSPAMSPDTTPPENPLPTLLLLGLLLTGLGTGIWYALTAWLQPESTHTVTVVHSDPAPRPGRVTVTREEVRTGAGNAPLPPSSSVPETRPVAEPPAPEQARNAAPRPPEYRAEIRDDDEGITIVLHHPRPAADPPPAASETVTPDSTPMRPVAAGQPVTEGEKTEAPSPPETRPVVQREIVHIVVRGDTLWDIAARYVHDPFRYPELARLSHIRNPDRIYPGDRVRILVVLDD